MNKLAIGTAQFGMKYGISNSSGKVKPNSVKKILEYALSKNITTIDTAISYGNSEQVLGEIGIEKFNIVTKLPKMPKNISNFDFWVKENVFQSLRKLKTNKMHALLLHDSSDFIGKAGLDLFSSLERLKSDGYIKSIGVSIYHPDELNEIEKRGIKLDIVQSPFNILDRRIEFSGWLDKLFRDNIEIHVRSVFLQGLLLQDPIERAPYFTKWENQLNRYDEWLAETQQSRLGAAINFVNSYKQINNIVVGVQNKSQLIEISQAISPNHNHKIPDNLIIDDLSLINPSNWKF